MTGAVTGIGRAIALAFLRNGASVTVNHLGDSKSQRDYESLQQEAPRNARLSAAEGDIRLPKTGGKIVEQAVSKFGSVDVIVANAGIAQFRDFLT